MENVEIKDYINIQNNKYVLIKVDNQLGYAEFTKGLSDKFE